MKKFVFLSFVFAQLFGVLFTQNAVNPAFKGVVVADGGGLDGERSEVC